MKFKSNIEAQSNIILDGALTDAGGSPGNVNQLLSSTVTGTAWIDPSTIVAEAATLVVIACKNTSGAAIAQGTPVYQTGTVGATATIEIAPADALISANKLPAIGLLQTALNNNGFGFVVITGELTNFTTSPIDGVVPTTGDKIFVKSGGGLTLTKPTGEGNGIQNMGLVGKVSGGNSGSITVSSIMRTNDVPNLPEGRIWIGDGNTIVSDTVYVDDPNSSLIVNGTTLQTTEALSVIGAGYFSDKVSIGTAASTVPGDNSYTLNLLDLNSAMAFGDNSQTSRNVIVGEYGTTDTDQLWLHGKNGTFFTYNNPPSIAGVIDSVGNFGLGTIAPTAKLDITKGNGKFCVDFKEHVVTNTFTTCLTINLASHTGCHVVLTCFGDWADHSTAAYRGEFFVQASGTGIAYNEPGAILRQDDNTTNLINANVPDQILCQIVDPPGTGNPKNFQIQIRHTDSIAGGSFTGQLTYTVQGKFNSIT